MAKINSEAPLLIDDYIEKLSYFSKRIYEIIRELIHKNEHYIIEDWKWKIPISHTTKMVYGFAVFKNM
jgi:hypothetical protein